MVSPKTPSTPTGWRWFVFILITATMAWVSLRQVESAVVQAEPPAPSQLDLVREVQQDFRLDFSHSVSEPLKKLAPHRTDGQVQPLWPWLAAWNWDTQAHADSQASLAWFQAGLVLGGLLVMAMVCARVMSLSAALLVLATALFHGPLTTVADFNGATLFQFFFLLAWMACLYGLQRNSLWVYGLIGAASAMAYLAEDRILPLLVVFLLLSTLRALWGWIAHHWEMEEGISLWVWQNHIFGLLLLAVAAGCIAGPRLMESANVFGNPAFHYQDQIRWLEDADSAKTWIMAHPDKETLDAVPVLERPSARLYWQTHGAPAVGERLRAGFQALLQQGLARWEVRLALALGVLVIILVPICGLCTPRASHAGERLHPETATAVLFFITALTAYGAIAAWDVQVMPVPHLQALAAPTVLGLLWASESLLRRARRRGMPRLLQRVYLIGLWVLFGLTCLPPIQAALGQGTP